MPDLVTAAVVSNQSSVVSIQSSDVSFQPGLQVLHVILRPRSSGPKNLRGSSAVWASKNHCGVILSMTALKLSLSR